MQGHGASVRAGDRRRPGAQRGVRPLRVHQRHHRPVLPPVRPDDRRLDADLGVQLADAQPGAGGPAAAAARRRARTHEVAAAAGLSAAGRLAGLRIPGPAGWLPGASRPRLAPDVALGRARGRGRRRRRWSAGSSAGRSTASSAGSSARSTSASTTRPTSTPARSAGCLRVSCAGAGGLRRPAGADLLGFRECPRRASFPRRTRAICWSTCSCPTRPRVERTEQVMHRIEEIAAQDARRQAHRGHRRPVDPAQRQRPELRRDVRHARRLPRPRRRRACPATPSPPSLQAGFQQRDQRRRWSTSSAPRRSTAWARPAASRSSSRTAATSA